MSKSQIESLNDFARVRLSKHFFMRDFLFSETASVLGLNNVPNNKELAIEAGKGLCQNVLEPIQDAWGRIHIRSAFRSEEVNQAGNEIGASCSTNDRNYGGHIWDVEGTAADGNKYPGATACIVIPAYLEYYEQTGDWTSLAWWIHHHVPAVRDMYFFPKLCAFNISWFGYAEQPKTISTYIEDPNTGHKKRILNKNVISDFYRDMPAEKRYEACKPLIAK